MSHKQQEFQYSDKYYDEQYEYRHVNIPENLARHLPRDHLLSDAEWRSLGISMSLGWQHYGYHDPEPTVLLFRRPLGTDPTTGLVNPELAKQARAQSRKEYGLDD